MTHASLFSGIGGAELAASWMGWQNLFHCEIQEFPRKVLEYWYPNSISYDDIKKTDFREWKDKVDVLTAGFPCQPFSVAGKRAGADDYRYLWPETIRAIREIQPAWFVGENVAGIISMVQPGDEVKMGCTDDLFEKNYIYRNEQEYTLAVICKDLERAGYAVQPFVIPACAVGAPHRRDRVWIVARLNTDTDCQRCAGRGSQTYKRGKASKRASVFRNIERHCGEQDVANSANARNESVQQGRKDGISESSFASHTKDGSGNKSETSQQTESKHEQIHIHRHVVNANGKRRDESKSYDGIFEETSKEKCRKQQPRRADCPQDWWRNFPTQSPVCSRNDGLPFDVADLAISFPKWRQEAIKALGNAWVPQVAYEIFKTIEQLGNIKNK